MAGQTCLWLVGLNVVLIRGLFVQEGEIRLETLADFDELHERLGQLEAVAPDWVLLTRRGEETDRDVIAAIRERYPKSEILVFGEAAAPKSLSRGEPSRLLDVVSVFATERSLSSQQATVLRLHVQGLHDKEIASVLGKAPATIYEHWRRMAHKLLGRTKSDVVAEFHRFLALEGSFVLKH